MHSLWSLAILGILLATVNGQCTYTSQGPCDGDPKCVWQANRCILNNRCSRFDNRAQCDSVSKCSWDVAGALCRCKDTLADFIFVVDESGSVGPGNYQKQKDFLEQALKQTIPANSGVGTVKFGSQITTVTALIPYQPIATVTSELKAMSYGDGGSTDMGRALRRALDLLKQSQKPNKFIFLATDGKPNGPINPCSLTTEIANTPGLHVLILGVSSGFSENAVKCLVQHEPDPQNWIITVPNFQKSELDKALPDLDGRFCPAGFQLKITEIKPQSDSNPAMVEILNQGPAALLRNIQIDGLFSGRLAAIGSNAMLNSSHVAVVYDPAGASNLLPNCTACDCIKQSGNPSRCRDAVYIASGGSGPISFQGTNLGMNLTKFYVAVRDATSSPPLNVDDITYGPGWPIAKSIYGLELQNFNLANNRGENWLQTCLPEGTPGAPPLLNCSQACVDRCQTGGDSNATCVQNTCKCSGEFYLERDVCLNMNPPSFCNALMKKIGPGQYQVVFEWDTVPRPPGLKYEGDYIKDSGDVSTFTELTLEKTIADQNAQEFMNAFNSQQSYGQLRTTYEIDNAALGATVYRSRKIGCKPQTPSPTMSPVQESIDGFVYVSAETMCPGRPRCGCTGFGSRTCTATATKNDVLFRKLSGDVPNIIEIARSPQVYPYNITVKWQVTTSNASTGAIPPKITTGTVRRLLSAASNCTVGAVTPVCPPSGELLIPAGANPKASIALNVEKSDRQLLFQITSCRSSNGRDTCGPAYPWEMNVTLNGVAQASNTNVTNAALPVWLWPLIAALVLLLVLMSFLAYRWWVKNKVTSAELDTTKKDLDVAIEENELGFGHDLGGDVEFNPMATGMPGMNMAADPYGTEIENRRDGAGNARADVAVEKFGFRQQMGQVQQGGMYNAQL